MKKIDTVLDMYTLGSTDILLELLASLNLQYAFSLSLFQLPFSVPFVLIMKHPV